MLLQIRCWLQSRSRTGHPRTRRSLGSMSAPPAPLTTVEIQRMLEENAMFIQTIFEKQNEGKLDECTQYQSKLQANLMHLAALADTQSAAGQAGTAVPPAAQAGQAGQQQHQQQQQQQQQR